MVVFGIPVSYDSATTSNWAGTKHVMTLILGRLKCQYMRRTNSLLGRFGGCWNWALGFQAGASTLIINCLVFSVRFEVLQSDK